MGLRDDKVADPSRDGDAWLTAACQLDEILRADVRQVATMPTDVSAKFSVNRSRNGRDIWQGLHGRNLQRSSGVGQLP